MEWLLVALLLVVAFGPVLWLMPSRTDRRLAKMRKRARELGLVVEIAFLKKHAATASERVSAGGKKKSPTLATAAYRRPFERATNHAPQWRLERGADGRPGPLAEWSWEREPERAPQELSEPYWTRMVSFMQRLPRDALAVEATRLDVACFWLEQVTDEDALGAVEALAVVLDDMKKAHFELNDLIEARLQAERDQ